MNRWQNWRGLLCATALFAIFPFVVSGDEPAAEEGSKFTPKITSGEVAEVTNKGVTGLGGLISDSVFDLLDGIDVYSVDVHKSGKGEVRIGRKVFNSQDIEESYTVVDRVQLPVSFPIFSIPLGTSAITLDLGARTGLDFANVRVVKPAAGQDRKQLLDWLNKGEDLQARKEQLDQSAWLDEAKKAFGKDLPYVSDGETAGKPVFLMDSLRRARYGKLWNMVAGPLKLPLRASWLDHFDINEVVTYGGYGAIELGVNAGYKLPVGGSFENAKSAGGVRAYLRGGFQIAVRKSGKDKAKVKVSRSGARGVGMSIGASGKVEIYDGFLLAGSAFGQKLHATVGRVRETLIPFRFEADRAWGESLEVGYEYDLKDERAIEAYEQAVLGRFGLSEEISDEEDAPVKALFTKEGRSKTTSQSVTISMLIFKHGSSSTYAIEDAEIEFPDGVCHVVKASNAVTFKNKLDLWVVQTKEQVSYSIHTDFYEPLDRNHERPAGAKSALIGLIGEGTIEDNYTAGRELNRYSHMVESLFGTKTLFEPVEEYEEIKVQRPPCLGEGCHPDDRGGEDVFFRPIRYGRAQYYFKFGLTEAQLLKMIQTPREKMWSFLERGFERKPGTWSSGTPRRVLSEAFGWFGDAVGWALSPKDVDRAFGPRFHRANLFKKRWQAAQNLVFAGRAADGSIQLTNQQKNELVRLIGKMYSEKGFVYELLNTTLLVLREGGDKQISYQVVAASAAFDSINMSGGSITEIEKVSQRYADETNFEAPQVRQDVTLGVSGLKVTQKSRQEFVVDLEMAREPRLVMIRLDEVSAFMRTTRTLRRLMVPNRGRFHAGANQIVIKPGETPTFESELASVIRPGKNYRITVALLDEANAGIPESEDFYANPKIAGLAPR